ncbi:MAG: amidohydrolase family protein [Lentisphaeria bacterium]
MKVFDIHTHIFPDKIAERTVQSLGEASGLTPSYNGTRAGLQQALQEAGLSGALNCPIATKPEQVDSITAWASRENRWPILSLGSIHPDYEDITGFFANLIKSGLPGIKLHPEYQHFELDDPRLVPIWEECNKRRLTVMLHTGADIAFTPPFHSGPEAVAALVDRYPDIKLIAAHFGGWEMWEKVEKWLLGKGVYLDTSFTLGRLSDADFVRMIREHGTERVLYGTDAPWRNQKADLEHFLRLPLSSTEKQQILWDNARWLLPLPIH